MKKFRWRSKSTPDENLFREEKQQKTINIIIDIPLYSIVRPNDYMNKLYNNYNISLTLIIYNVILASVLGLIMILFNNFLVPLVSILVPLTAMIVQLFTTNILTRAKLTVKETINIVLYGLSFLTLTTSITTCLLSKNVNFVILHTILTVLSFLMIVRLINFFCNITLLSSPVYIATTIVLSLIIAFISTALGIRTYATHNDIPLDSINYEPKGFYKLKTKSQEDLSSDYDNIFNNHNVGAIDEDGNQLGKLPETSIYN